MSVLVVPDVKNLVIEYLASRSELKALVGNRVATRLLGRQPLPCVTVVRIAGSAMADVHWGMGVLIQVDAWADVSREDEAWLIASTAQGCMADPNMQGVHSRGVVTGVRMESDLRDAPAAVVQHFAASGGSRARAQQTDVRPRVSFDARVYVHP